MDGLSENEVHKCIETFIYGVNIPSRWGTQSPFSNIGFDWVVPEELKDTPCIVGGQPQNFTYKDCQKEMCMIQKVFLDILIHGDQTGRGFKFPIPTISITKDFDFEMEKTMIYCLNWQQNMEPLILPTVLRQIEDLLI